MFWWLHLPVTSLREHHSPDARNLSLPTKRFARYSAAIWLQHPLPRHPGGELQDSVFHSVSKILHVMWNFWKSDAQTAVNMRWFWLMKEVNKNKHCCKSWALDFQALCFRLFSFVKSDGSGTPQVNLCGYLKERPCNRARMRLVIEMPLWIQWKKHKIENIYIFSIL